MSSGVILYRLNRRKRRNREEKEYGRWFGFLSSPFLLFVSLRPVRGWVFSVDKISRKAMLPGGVMVTLEILVLSLEVRVLPG